MSCLHTFRCAECKASGAVPGAFSRRRRHGPKGLDIGGGAHVGAGAVVTAEVANGTTVVGNPARRMR